MANWLKFKKIEDWETLTLLGFQYDSITDEQIGRAIGDLETLKDVDTSIDWEDDRWLSRCTTVPEDQKHTYRIAALVNAFTSSSPMQKSITLDTFSDGQCCSCVTNGHHRVRALQYLGMEQGPFNLNGIVDQLENLVSIAGSECPEEFKKYFSKKLLKRYAEDIAIRKMNPKTHG